MGTVLAICQPDGQTGLNVRNFHYRSNLCLHAQKQFVSTNLFQLPPVRVLIKNSYTFAHLCGSLSKCSIR